MYWSSSRALGAEAGGRDEGRILTPADGGRLWERPSVDPPRLALAGAHCADTNERRALSQVPFPWNGSCSQQEAAVQHPHFHLFIDTMVAGLRGAGRWRLLQQPAHRCIGSRGATSWGLVPAQRSRSLEQIPPQTGAWFLCCCRGNMELASPRAARAAGA
ncbi:hypothetical protein NDU88_005404 [Pleurodeles waltl]|uniref:Uncharacterized protein n=1 Tax=Pleurodeles waltl TaxID=8319 RepID=A0AAV7L0P1_PLEWA|nr:hypothetical protein NDU88_005404 [Pleurodeles waltl]